MGAFLGRRLLQGQRQQNSLRGAIYLPQDGRMVGLLGQPIAKNLGGRLPFVLGDHVAQGGRVLEPPAIGKGGACGLPLKIGANDGVVAVQKDVIG